MKRAVWILSIAFFTFVSTGVLGATAVWEKDFTTAPTWQRLTNDGNLMVSAEDKLSVYRGTTGDQMWERNDLWAQSTRDIRILGNSGLFLAEAMPADQVDRERKRRPKRKKDEFLVLTAVDVLSGEDYWVMDFLRGELIDIRVVNQDEVALVFQSVAVKNREESGIYVTAVNLGDGAVMWETQFADRRAKVTGKNLRGLNGHSAITIDGDVAYIPYLGVHAVDLRNGEILWQSAFRKRAPELLSAYAAPLVNDGKIYASDSDMVYAFDQASGEQLWRAKVRRAKTIPELHMAGSTLIARFGGTFTNGRKVTQVSSFGVAAIEPASGEVLWNFDDAREGITNLIVQEDRNRIMFADGIAILGLSIDEGELLFAAPLAFYRQYGIFKAKKGGFAISGGYSQTGPGGTTGESGGLGGGGCSFDLGDLPIDITLKGEELVVRGQSHIMTFDPRVMLVQWSAIFSETDPSDRTLLSTGGLPDYSQKDVSYYLTEMSVGRGRSNRDQFMILGMNKEDGKVVSRLDVPGKDPRLLIDHDRDLVYVMQDGRRKSMNLTAYSL